MVFDEALKRCKEGAKIRRKSWNDENKYVEFSTNVSYENYYGKRIGAKLNGIGNWGLVLVTNSGVRFGWRSSGADKFADDWEVVSAEKTATGIVNDLLIAAEYCRADCGCENCPYYQDADCTSAVLTDAKMLINYLGLKGGETGRCKHV